MAKSKTGGSRAYLRGRIGADVYSIGKDSKGMKQQVVRSLAETVANPQTTAQMQGRMIMSTVMQAVSALRFIVDHSFDEFSGKQPNLSEFIRRNYALIKADVAAHPSANNSFGLNLYQEKGIKAGAYVISEGNAKLPSSIMSSVSQNSIRLEIEASTVGVLKGLWELESDEYITLVAVSPGVGVEAVRIKFASDLADDTTITASNVESLFTFEGNASVSVTFDDQGFITLLLTSTSYNGCGMIVSRKQNGTYIHNTCTLMVKAPTSTADIALPTYPIGAQLFLNGGDI